ncbi:MAG TPA: PH domain-containing protein [Vicinamibacterales bacterium]|nr:PH domain-containing protein [Vicinamibacterales bacterium]
MPSEQRLHPASILFSFGSVLKRFALPGLLVLVAGRRSETGADVWMMLLLIPAVLLAITRYLTFRIRYEPHELIIRSGLVFRNERHIPYARIQNLEAIRHVVHRLLGVVEVRVENAAGKDPEATISVLPEAAFGEMRRRVFEGRADAPPVQSEASAADAARPHPGEAEVPLLRLRLRDLLLCGFIENRGFVLIGAVYGFLWQLGPIARFWSGLLQVESTGSGLVRDTLRSIARGDSQSAGKAAVVAAGVLGLLVLVRIVSMCWAAMRLYDFRLTRVGEDLRLEFGLFTRVTTTTPRQRIQTLTIRETPLHRLFHRVSVRVETAGGSPAVDRSQGIERDWIAPVIRSDDLPVFLRSVVPELDLQTIPWQQVHARAFSRAVKPHVVIAIVATTVFMSFLGWRAIALLPFALVWAVLAARRGVKSLGWSVTDDVVAFRRGWLWRVITAARTSKIQAVALRESPFDRRTAMARLRVDTAGAGQYRIDVPYVPAASALAAYRSVSRRAATLDFQW